HSLKRGLEELPAAAVVAFGGLEDLSPPGATRYNRFGAGHGIYTSLPGRVDVWIPQPGRSVSRVLTISACPTCGARGLDRHRLRERVRPDGACDPVVFRSCRDGCPNGRASLCQCPKS